MRLALKNLLFTVIIPGSVAVYVPLLIGFTTGGAPEHTAAGARVLALPPLSLGAGVYLWCLWDFASYGRGTPAPIDAPQRLVIRGLYRYVRNPMYVGVLLVILGWAIRFASPVLLAYAAAVWLAFHLMVTLYEEPTLRKAFGESYEAYSRATPRWLPARPGS